jgi:molybdopterin synthase catalytic subunit
MIEVALVDEPIAIEQWSDKLVDFATGAHGWFAGVTRQTTATRSGGVRVTKTLHYQAHRAMALSELRKLAEQAKRQHELCGVVIVHRLGEVPLGEASVLVGCGAAHRASVFAAMPWIMDRLKADVPIWKQETYEDDRSEWIHP